MDKLKQLRVVKRDGRVVDFNVERIQEAIFKAAYNGEFEDNKYHADPIKANHLANTVTRLTVNDIIEFNEYHGHKSIDIETIQNIVVRHLSTIAPKVGAAYLNYKTIKNIERG